MPDKWDEIQKRNSEHPGLHRKDNNPKKDQGSAIVDFF